MSADNILVTVVINIYNSEKFMDRCVSSAIAQTYRNTEILLIDDGSTDSSAEICGKFEKTDKRVKTVRLENGGVSIARNVAIEMANGEYICFVDGDDYLACDYVEYLLGLCLRFGTDVGVAKNIFSEKNISQTKTDRQKAVTGMCAAADILCYKIPIGPWSKMFKTSFLIENNIRFPEGIFNGDGFVFNTTAFCRTNKTAIGERKVYHYFWYNEGSGSNDFKYVTDNSIRAQQIIKSNIDAVSGAGLLKRCWEYSNWHTHSDVYLLMKKQGLENVHPEIYARARSVTRRKWRTALLADTSFREKIRAALVAFAPSLVMRISAAKKKARLKRMMTK